jgi:hypothetical protein
MNDYMKRQAEEFLNAAKAVQMPENVQAFAQESVAKTREAYDKLSGAAKDQAKVAEDMLSATQAGAKAIGTKVLDNVAMNAEAAFDAAEAIVKARTLPEAARLQAEFMQKQFAAAGAQTKPDRPSAKGRPKAPSTAGFSFGVAQIVSVLGPMPAHCEADGP